jgi:cytochrome c oxidase assembly factor CtaG
VAVVSFDPAVVALLLLAAALYVRAVRVLAARGYDVPRGQQVAWWGGLALIAVALLGPPDTYSGDLMSAHMVQHLLIADLAAPLLLVGMRTPVLVFFLPRPVLVPLARRRRLRAAFRTIRQPLPAMGIYILILYAWHLGFAFEGALRNPVVHALQHESFVIASVLVWWSVIEPKRRRLRGELWKIGQVLGCRLAGMFLAMAFIIASTPLYAGYYGERAREHGISPLLDQQIAGGLMMGLDLLIMFFALGFFFYRSAQDHDRAEALERAEAREGAPAPVA